MEYKTGRLQMIGQVNKNMLGNGILDEKKGATHQIAPIVYGSLLTIYLLFH